MIDQTEDTDHFELPKKIEDYLSLLSKHYGQMGEKQLQSVLVNSSLRIHKEWDMITGTVEPIAMRYI